MKKGFYVLLLLCLVFILAAAGCSNNVTSANEASVSRTSVNAASVSEAPTSAASVGGAPANETSTSEVSANDASASGASANEASTGAASASEASASEMAQNGEEKTKTNEKTTTDGDVDVDLTVLSSMMVYAEVSNILSHPNDYLGRTIKIKGPYYAIYYDDVDLFDHYVVIEDASSCCAQGMKFIWNGEHTYPDDYPEDFVKIEVIGVYNSYEESGEMRYFLAIDDISIL